MGRMSRETQQALRRSLTDLGAGQAESEGKEPFIRRFHPIPEHLRAFDPDITLVVGDRGAGKSELFNAIFTYGLLPTAARRAPQARLAVFEPGRAHWVAAYPLHADFPDSRGLRAMLAKYGAAREAAVNLWFAYLVRTLRDHLDEQARRELEELLAAPGGDVEEVARAFAAAASAPLLALDRLDQALQEQGRWLFVGYDELDTLGGYDWEVMARALSGLVAFWAGYSRRWKRLRAKLFLRSDLFRRHTGFGGADLAKLAANRAELVWNDRNLYAMLIKRIANSDDGLLNYCRSARIPFLDRPDPDLGWIPHLAEPTDAYPLVERLAGTYMGTDARKGRSATWVVDHLRDGRGCVAPRDLVRLFEYAAGKEQANALVEAPRLIHPTALRQALEDVSGDHVRQALSNEWPWLDGVKQRLHGHGVPAHRHEVIDWLRHDWDGPWAADGVRPPAASAGELLAYLLELGVLRERSGDRIDAPGLYQYGCGLRRQGGVRRR